MLKNGRPYTCEDGNIDGKLLTDLPKTKAEHVKKWIAKYIIVNPNSMFAYGGNILRQTMEQDIDVRITDNQLKDAMLLCGHKPLDPNSRNWYYRLADDCKAIKPEFDGKRKIRD